MDNMSVTATKEVFVSTSSLVKIGHIEAISPQTMTSQLSALCQMQAKEADVRALAELMRVLDKKNALVTEMRCMNDDIMEDSSLEEVDSFKKQYAAVLVQLNEALDQVSSALMCLRQRNTYQGNPNLPLQKAMAILEDCGSLVSNFNRLQSDSQETGSHVYEIVETSRVKARKMAVSSLKEGANAAKKIVEAIDFVNNRLIVDDSCLPAQATQINGSVAHQNQLSSCISNLVAPDQVLVSKSNGATVEYEAQLPSELITNCVSTLLMIQKCTERHFPPSDVAQILDFDVTSLQPCSSLNIPIYAEIQKCMGIIRSQISALVLT